MLYYDKWILNEDYIKLPGDENVEKRHMNLRKLLIKKEKGDLTDTSTERSIKKSWQGFPLLSFSYKDKIFEIKFSEETEDKGKKDKKAPPPKDKKTKGGDDVVVVDKQDENNTQNIISFKTFRQKSAFSTATKAYVMMKKDFDNGVQGIEDVYNEVTTKETYFEFYFENTRNKLFDYN